MRKNPFFSVVIPSFNRAEYLRTAVSSVLNQTFPDLELIVIDDGSTDNTEEIISIFSDERIKYFKQDNHGVSHARNKGINSVSGSFIAFLDSDDHWLPEKLELTYDYIHRFPEIRIFHTEEIWFRRGELLKQKVKHKKPSGWVFQNALSLCCIGMSTSVVKHDVFARIGVFDETFEACEDYDLWLRATNLFEVKLITEALTIKHGGRKDQLSVKTWGLDRFRIRALEKILRYGNLSDNDRSLAFDQLKKKCEVFAKGCEKRSRLDDAEYYHNLYLSPDLAP